MSGRVFLHGLNQYLARINVSWSMTQCSYAGEARTRGPSVSSQAYYHWATAPPPHPHKNWIFFWKSKTLYLANGNEILLKIEARVVIFRYTRYMYNHSISAINNILVRGSRGGQGVRTPLPKNHKNIGFLSNTSPDPLKNHKSQHSMLGHNRPWFF